MAVTDQQFQQLLNSLNDLTRTIKQDKNSFGSSDSDSGGTRMGRGGSANSRSVRNSNKAVEALADNLNELHKSFKSGGRTIADHFKDMVKNINPLNAAFGRLEDAVKDAATTQTKAYNLAAKHTLDYVKKVSGNVDKLKELNDDYADLAATVSDIVDNQEEYAKNQELLNQKLKKAADARIKIEQSGIHGGKPVLSGPLALYLKNLEKNPNTKLSHNAQYGANQLNDQYKAVSDLTKQFFTDVGNSVKKATEEFQRSIESTMKALGSAIVKDAEKIPSYISSRLKYGFESNEFIDAFRMGMSSDELNQLRAANRDVINSVTGFGKYMEKDATDSLRVWSDNAKQVGLIGQEAAQFTSDWMRSAFQTGRTYNIELNRELTNQAQTLQQIFGGSIQESAKLIQDYSTQVYNIAKFNRAQTAEQQAVLQKELTTRMLYTKYMGYDIEYMKQQEQMRHNAQFGDIADRIRGAVMGQISAQDLGGKLGWSDSDRALWAKSRRPGAQLNDVEQKRLLSLNSDVSQFKQGYERRASAASDVGGFIAALAPNIASERFISGSGGDTMQGMVDNDIRAQAQRNARGDISFADYLKFAEENQKKQADSITIFESAVQEFSESIRGFGGLPGAAIAGAIGGSLTNIIGAILKRKLAGGALETIAGRGAGGILGRIGLGGLGAEAGAAGAGGAAAGGIGLGAAAAGTAAVAGAGLTGWGIGTGLSKWGKDAYYSDNSAYKMASQALNPLGYGASAIGDYFSNKQYDNINSIMDRVSETGQYTQDDISALIKLKEVGDWWVTDEESESNRQASIQQLEQLASFAKRRQANTVAGDRPRSNAIALGTDGAAGIQRDANGNIIQNNPNDPMVELVEIQREALGVVKDSKKEDRERAEREQVMEEQRSKAQQQQDFLAGQYRLMF